MAKQTPELFKNRSATKEFLFSPSEDLIDAGSEKEICTDRDNAAVAPPNALFPDMLDRKGLADAIDTRMATASMLCALAVRMDRPSRERPDGQEETGLGEDAAMPVARLCRAHDGAWAKTGRNRLVCVLPHLAVTDGGRLARKLMDAVTDNGRPRITIGVATYPTINYTRGQIVDNAEKALEHAGFFGPGTITRFDAVSLNISGDRHYQAGDITAAMDEFQKGLLLDPADVNLQNSLGVCHGVLKDYDNALAAFEKAIWLAPEDVMAIYNKGYVLLLQGNRELALECFRQADDREPNVFEVVFHIGQTLVEMGKNEKARPYLEDAVRINARSGPAFKSLGACLDALGLTREAIQAYKNVVKIYPEDADALSILGQLYTRLGESLDVAAVLCEQSVRLRPDDGVFRHRLGNVYLNQGKLDHALAEFELADSLGHGSRSQIEATQDLMMAAKAS